MISKVKSYTSFLRIFNLSGDYLEVEGTGQGIKYWYFCLLLVIAVNMSGELLVAD